MASSGMSRHVALASSPNRRNLQEPHGKPTPEDAILHSQRRENLKSYFYTRKYSQPEDTKILSLEQSVLP
jgi:hypothetical protein